MIWTILLYAILALCAALNIVALWRMGQDIGKWLFGR